MIRFSAPHQPIILFTAVLNYSKPVLLFYGGRSFRAGERPKNNNPGQSNEDFPYHLRGGDAAARRRLRVRLFPQPDPENHRRRGHGNREPNDGYSIKTVVYDEKSGQRIAVNDFASADGVELGRPSPAPNSAAAFTIDTAAFGPVKLCEAPGLDVILKVTSTPKDDVAKLGCFIILQYGADGKIERSVLNVPEIEITPGYPLLLLQRAKGITVVPLDKNSQASITRAKRISHEFSEDLLSE